MVLSTSKGSEIGMSRFLKYLATIVAVVFGCVALEGRAQDGGRNVAVLIGGLGGSPEYSEKFEQYLYNTRKGLVDNYGFNVEDVFVLGEAPIVGKDYVGWLANAENIREVFGQLKNTLSADDRVFIFLFGHGSYDGTRSVLNIPRRDLTDADYASLVNSLPTDNIVFVNTASASGPFISAISGTGRVVITSTKSGTEKNETVFPKFVSEGLANGDADLDRNGSVSVAELFRYAAENTARDYEVNGLLASEHALLDDTGDARGFQFDELETNGEGALAAVTYVGSRDRAFASGGGGNLSPEQANRRTELERSIASLKSAKAEMGVDEYYAALEVLFVELARLEGGM